LIVHALTQAAATSLKNGDINRRVCDIEDIF